VLAAGVDGAVRRIGRTYEIRGMVEKVTSFSDAAGSTVVNEVRNGYNAFTQLALQYQEHAGAVNTGTTPRVSYAYADGSANTIWPTAMTYPNGRVLNVNYAGTPADKLSRLDGVAFGTNVADFDYLGVSTFTRTGYPQPGIQNTLATGTGSNRYASLDRFGRIINKLWDKAGTALVQLQYGYDRSSNRTYRKDVVARGAGQDLDELYRYDGLNQLKKFHRGITGRRQYGNRVAGPTAGVELRRHGKLEELHAVRTGGCGQAPRPHTGCRLSPGETAYGAAFGEQ